MNMKFITIKSSAIALIGIGFVVAAVGLWLALEQGSVVGGVCAAVATASVLINVRHL